MVLDEPLSNVSGDLNENFDRRILSALLFNNHRRK